MSRLIARPGDQRSHGGDLELVSHEGLTLGAGCPHLDEGANMAQRRLRFLALWIAGCMVCRPGHCAAVADHLDAAAAVRKADAAWKAAASNAGVDAWAAFYAADAVVSLPRAPLVSGTGPLRDAVSRLLALPRFSIAWRPIALEVARSGSGDCRPTEFGNAPPMIGTWMRPARRPPTHSRCTPRRPMARCRPITRPRSAGTSRSTAEDLRLPVSR
jgi:hypothetical protein